MDSPDCFALTVLLVVGVVVVVSAVRVASRLAEVERSLDELRDVLTRIARRDAERHAAWTAPEREGVPGALRAIGASESSAASPAVLPVGSPA